MVVYRGHRKTKKNSYWRYNLNPVRSHSEHWNNKTDRATGENRQKRERPFYSACGNYVSRRHGFHKKVGIFWKSKKFFQGTNFIKFYKTPNSNSDFERLFLYSLREENKYWKIFTYNRVVCTYCMRVCSLVYFLVLFIFEAYVVSSYFKVVEPS